MRKTKVRSTRFPRKLKKEIIKVFGQSRYKGLLNSQQFIQAKLVGRIGENCWKYTFEGYGIFFEKKF